VLASELRRVLDRLEPRPVDPRRDSSSILPLDERPDKSPAAVLFLGVIVAAVVAAAVVWWWVSQ
jgi:hypothetical protein